MPHGFKIEIKGNYALFCRPELKVERVSYDVITPSAARGILEAVFWKPAIRYVIDQITVCSHIQFDSIRRNEVNSKISYVSPQKAAKDLANGNLYLASNADRAQRSARVLRCVRYLIDVHFELTDKVGASDNEGKYAEMIKRYHRKGMNFHAPYLGVREFPAKVRLIEEGESLPEPIDESRDLGLMLYDMEYSKEKDENGNTWVTEFRPTFFWANMQNGILDLRDVEVLR